MTGRLLTVRDCAEELQVCTKTIYRAVWAKELEALRVGGRLRIRPEALERYLEAEKRDRGGLSDDV